MKDMVRLLAGALLIAAMTMTAGAQTSPDARGKQGAFTADPLDLAVIYTASHSGLTSGQNGFWLQGGGAEVSARVWRGLSETGNITGLHVADSGDGVPVNLVIVSFGPRLSWQLRRSSRHPLQLFGEGLFGVANGFSGVYPQAGGATDAAGSFALLVGGGVDYPLNHAFSLRLIQADWLRTQLPNATTNVQNNLLLGVGTVWHIR